MENEKEKIDQYHTPKKEEEEIFYFDSRTKIYIEDIETYLEKGRKYGRDFLKTKVQLKRKPTPVFFIINGKKKVAKRIIKFIQDKGIDSEFSYGYWKSYFIKDKGEVWSKIDDDGFYIGPAMTDLIDGKVVPIEPPIGFKNPYWNKTLKKWDESISIKSE